MLCKNIAQIGNKLYEVRKKKGLTQAQVAEKAELSDRTYADIERGSANMRVDTMLSICEALRITPNELFVEENVEADKGMLVDQIERCSTREQAILLQIIDLLKV